MSVCDPDGGMHALWTRRPAAAGVRADAADRLDAAYVERPRATRSPSTPHELAAVIVEPVVQGAGGMRFHDPRYLACCASSATDHDVLLVFDEIATGFGRTGELFAADHAGVAPDVMCVGKALTGGYLTLAATLCTPAVARGDQRRRGRRAHARSDVHGATRWPAPSRSPRSGCCSTRRLARRGRRDRRARLERGLAPARELPGVVDVRVLGAIGVVDSSTARSTCAAATAAAVGARGVAAAVPQPGLHDAAVRQ